MSSLAVRSWIGCAFAVLTGLFACAKVSQRRRRRNAPSQEPYRKRQVAEALA